MSQHTCSLGASYSTIPARCAACNDATDAINQMRAAHASELARLKEERDALEQSLCAVKAAWHRYQLNDIQQDEFEGVVAERVEEWMPAVNRSHQSKEPSGL